MKPEKQTSSRDNFTRGEPSARKSVDFTKGLDAVYPVADLNPNSSNYIGDAAEAITAAVDPQNTDAYIDAEGFTEAITNSPEHLGAASFILYESGVTTLPDGSVELRMSGESPVHVPPPTEPGQPS